MNKAIRYFFLGQLITVVLVLLFHNEFSLLAYVNMSFSVGGIMLFTGLVFFVFSTGFFDVFLITSRKIFTPKHRVEEIDSMRAPSQLFTGSITPLLGGGTLILTGMGIGLLFYYI
ncbi:DUF3899 domain-containing protein [Sporosarcina sp. FSL W7-1349]|uniref:DUF3899 domain-containing protein n=1 Tax=Sporosarcina sp. FSL W7-1349 TaxID=2921561 RepID=UPI0030FA09B4